MKKYIAILILLCCVGCTEQPTLTPLYEQGQFVKLLINGQRGQILQVRVNKDTVYYHIRVDTRDGPKKMWLVEEFELTLETP